MTNADPDDLVAGSPTRRNVLVIAAITALAIGLVAVAIIRSGDGPEAGKPIVADGGNLGDQNDARALSGQLAPELEATRSTDGAPLDPVASKCAESESALPEGQADLVYSAKLQWEGTPAVVLGYRVEGDLNKLLLVMAQDDCRLLVTQSS